MVTQELLPQHLPIFGNDPDQSIGIFGVIAHQLGKCLHLAFQPIQAPQSILETFGCRDSLDHLHEPKLFVSG
jgi:hypothetical protein